MDIPLLLITPEIHFDSVCVTFKYSTKVRVRGYNFTFYIVLTVMEEFFICISPLIL